MLDYNVSRNPLQGNAMLIAQQTLLQEKYLICQSQDCFATSMSLPAFICGMCYRVKCLLGLAKPCFYKHSAVKL